MSVLARVGPYNVLDRRPEGGSVLCLATHSSDGRQVLVRLLSIADVGVATRERLAGELEALALVQHRNLVQVIDVVDDASGLGLVTEVLEGTTLDEAAATHPLGVRAVLDVGAQVCAGLHFGHALGLSHGRLRADQVCLTRDGTAKVLNLGLSLIERVVTAPDRPDADIDRATDDWRLADLRGVGAILYQGLTGREPSSPRSLRTTLLDRDRVPALDDAPAAVRDQLVALIELLLDEKKDPRATCADAAGLGRALTAARLAVDEPSVEAAASTTEQMATILMEPTIGPAAAPFDGTFRTPATTARTWPLGSKPEGASPPAERVTVASPLTTPPVRPSAPPKPQPLLDQAARVAEAPPARTRTPVQTAKPAPVGRAERAAAASPAPATRLGPMELGTMLAPMPTTPLPPATPDRRTRDVAVWGSIGGIALVAAGLAFWLMPGAAPGPSSGPATTTIPAGTWTLSLDSDPQGATVVVDGVPKPELTPLDLAVPRNPYPRIELTLEGFRPARVPLSDTVRLNGRVRMHLEPVPSPGGARKVPVRVSGSFPFEIIQGGRVISPAGSEHALDVRAGELITVRSAEFYLERSFLVPPEGLHVTLPAVAKVAFEATAADQCAIAIGNTITDSAPGVEPLLVPLGTYQFSLRCRDGRPRIRTAQVLDVPLNRVTFPSVP